MKKILLYKINILSGVIEIEDDKIISINKELQNFIGQPLSVLEQAIKIRKYKITYESAEEGELK